jgi:von Willebrand factor type A domain/Aerotolerance regulator N-terminal
VIFASIFGLFIAALGVLPWLAHRLRLRTKTDVPFAATHLLDEVKPVTRTRSRLEDRALFAVRAIIVALLALLASSPFVQCSKLSLNRGSASIALVVVVDDSMSMRAVVSGTTQFDRAREKAEDLVSALRSGDAIGVVLAGEPARLVLGPTEDHTLVRKALRDLRPSDRATALSDALALAQTAVLQAPQGDKRVAVLSDLADGSSAAAEPLSLTRANIQLWFPELSPVTQDLPIDCAVTSVLRQQLRVRVHIACSEERFFQGLRVTLENERGEPLAKDERGEPLGAVDAATDVTLLIPASSATLPALRVHLVRAKGPDAIPSNDTLPILPEGSRLAIGVISHQDETLVTSQTPVVEQALAALQLPMTVQPIAQVPEQPDDLLPYAGLILDDLPGLNPEQRLALGKFFSRGGMALIALGKQSAAPPLGSTWEPVLRSPVHYADTLTKGLALPLSREFGDSSEGALDLGLRKTTKFSASDLEQLRVRGKFSDGSPFFATSPQASGEAWLLALPFSLDDSDLALRPFTLDFLDAFARKVGERAESPLSDVGVPWRVRGRVSEEDAKQRGLEFVHEANGTVSLIVFPTAGLHEVKVDGRTVKHVALPLEREVSFRKRKTKPSEGTSQGEPSRYDIGWILALGLLAFIALEALTRTFLQQRESPGAA